MTISLAIDTSTSRTIVAIVDNDKVLFESFHEGATDHGKALPELVAQALQVAPKPERVVVGVGPGPFRSIKSPARSWAPIFSPRPNISCAVAIFIGLKGTSEKETGAAPARDPCLVGSFLQQVNYLL